MKKIVLTISILIAAYSIKAQEWEDPITISDWDQLWKSSFVQGNNASNAPESSGWFWGINMNHGSNSPSYRYNGQIAIKNHHNTPTMYFRSTNQNGSGVWSKVVNSYPNSSIGGELTAIKSLRVYGNNLHGDDLNFMNNSASMLIGWNRSASHGETDFISNRGAGSLGGFEFRDISNTGTELLLMKITGNGQVGIGTSTMGTHLLAVDGTIGAREIKVETNNWPDFVFGNDYNLRSLEEVESYITENKHLPEIPGEAEVTENGINLGEMNAKLLQKIEELTLYLIEQNKQNQAQQAEIEALKAKITKLESK